MHTIELSEMGKHIYALKSLHLPFKDCFRDSIKKIEEENSPEETSSTLSDLNPGNLDHEARAQHWPGPSPIKIYSA